MAKQQPIDPDTTAPHPIPMLDLLATRAQARGKVLWLVPLMRLSAAAPEHSLLLQEGDAL